MYYAESELSRSTIQYNGGGVVYLLQSEVSYSDMRYFDFRNMLNLLSEVFRNSFPFRRYKIIKYVVYIGWTMPLRLCLSTFSSISQPKMELQTFCFGTILDSVTGSTSCRWLFEIYTCHILETKLFFVKTFRLTYSCETTNSYITLASTVPFIYLNIMYS